MGRLRTILAASGLLLLGALSACDAGSPPVEGDDDEPGAGGSGTGSRPGAENGGSGTGSSSSSSGGATSAGGSGDRDPGPCDRTQSFGEGALLKLSTLQYKNTVRDLASRYELDGLLGDDLDDKLDLVPEDTASSGFRGLDDRISLEHVQGFFDVALLFGDLLTSNAEARKNVAGTCAEEDVLSGDCWDDFVDGFLRVAYRRPLSSAEKKRLESLRDSVASPAERLRAAVVVALSSPRFLYHVEVDGTEDDDRGVLALDAHERAARLSYTFWQTPPDQALMDAADDGSLLDDDVYERELKRVFTDPRTKGTLFDFWTEWLGLDRFTGFETTRPAFQSLTEGEHFGEPGHDHYADMVTEVRELTELFTFGKKGTVRDLLETNISTTRSEDLASLYGIAPWDGKSDYPLLDPGERAGLLHRGALLVSNLEETNPFHRGATVRRKILCGNLPQPDPNSLPPGSLDPPPPDEALSTRQRFAKKVDGGPCGECHDSFSTIGYVLESYDAVGRYRTEERVFDPETGDLLATLEVNASGVAGIESLDEGPVNGPIELNERIVESGLVESCLARNYFEFVMRRAAEKGSFDACVIEDLGEILGSDGQGLAEAFTSIVRGGHFTERKLETP